MPDKKFIEQICFILKICNEYTIKQNTGRWNVHNLFCIDYFVQRLPICFYVHIWVTQLFAKPRIISVFFFCASNQFSFITPQVNFFCMSQQSLAGNNLIYLPLTFTTDAISSVVLDWKTS